MKKTADQTLMSDHFTIFVYPFEHGLFPEYHHFLEQAWEAGWRPWVCRPDDFGKIDKLPEELRKYFNPPAMEMLYPEIHRLLRCKEYYCNVCESDTCADKPDTEQRKELFRKLANHAANEAKSVEDILNNLWHGLSPDDTVRLTFRFEKEEKRHWKFRFVKEGKTEEIAFRIDWADAYLFRFGVGFLCLKVHLENNERQSEDQAERLMLFHQCFRDIDSIGRLVCENSEKSLSKSEFLKERLFPLQVKHKSSEKEQIFNIEDHSFRLKLFSFVSLKGENWFDDITKANGYYRGTDRMDGILYEIASVSDPAILSWNKHWQPSREYLQEELLRNNKISIWRYWRGMALRDTAVFVSLAETDQPPAVQYENLHFPLYVYVLNLKMQLFQFSNRLNLRRLKKDEPRIREALEDFLIFRNDFWFCEVSPNFQMSLLFQKFKYGLELDADYEGVNQEVGNIFQYQESQSGRRLNMKVLILTAGAVIVGIFGINADMIGCKIDLEKDFFLYVYYRLLVLARFLTLSAFPLILLFLYITGRLSRKTVKDIFGYLLKPVEDIFGHLRRFCGKLEKRLESRSVYRKLCSIGRKVKNVLFRKK